MEPLGFVAVKPGAGKAAVQKDLAVLVQLGAQVGDGLPMGGFIGLSGPPDKALPVLPSPSLATASASKDVLKLLVQGSVSFGKVT